jgi:WD40 repeat protein
MERGQPEWSRKTPDRPEPADSVPGWTGYEEASAAIPSACTDASDDFGFGVGASTELPPGTDLGGVTIVGAIGAGGMGRVYEARQQSPHRAVAVKVMREGLVSASQMRRFDYEAQVLARLRHPHVAQIHALATARIGGVTVPYLVMELVPNARTVTAFCEAEGLAVRRRVELMRCVSAAVAHGHQKGVIHRDLKPGNILVDGAGEPKVIDFGVARSTDADAARPAMTDAGQIVGTLHYMSPEQLAGRADDVDARSDVHALGLVLHELLVGVLPYDIRGRSVIEAVRIVHEQEPKAAAAVAAAVRADRSIAADEARSLGVIVATCLEKNPSDRYATAAELESDLGRWLAGEAILARPLSSWESLVRLARRHRAAATAAVASVAALVAAVVGISFFAIRAEREGASARAQLYRSTLLLAGVARDRGAEAEARRLLSVARGLVADAGAKRPIELSCLAASLDEAIATLPGHAGTVRALAWAAGHVRLASGGADGALRVWEPVDGEGGPRAAWRHSVLATLDEELWAVAFSPAGDRVAAACADGTARIWDVPSGAAIARCTGHAGVVYGVAFSADGGRVLTAGRDGTGRIWDAGTGRERVRLEGHAGTVYSVAVSPDGGLAATGSQDATVRLWDAATGMSRAELRGHADRVFCVAFSPSGDLLASASEDATVRVWDVAAAEERAVLRHAMKVNAVAFTAEGKLVTATNDAVLRIWDPSTGLEVGRRLGHDGGVWSVACVAQGAWFASGGTDATVRIWRDDYGGNPSLPCSGRVRSVAHDPQGTRLAVGTVSGVEMWSPEKGRRLGTFSHDGRQVNDVRFFPDGRHLATACDRGIVEVWRLPDDRAESLSETDAMPLRFEAHSRRVYAVDVDPAGRRLATAGEDKAARVWEWGETPHETAAFKHEKRVLCCRFSADGARLYTACEDRIARVWAIATGRELRRFAGHSGPVNWLAVSPDTRSLATASSDGMVRLWDVETGRLQATLTGLSQQVWKVAFAPDGSRVVAVSADGGVAIWDASSGETVSLLRGHEASVWGVSVSPRGDAVVSGGDDGTLRFWGVAATAVDREAREGRIVPLTAWR